MRVSLSQEFFTNASINLESMPSQLEKVGKIFRLLEVEKYCHVEPNE